MSDDDVGYKKPPKHSQWKSGQSGNPKGRPKKAQHDSLHRIDEVLSEPVTATRADGTRETLGIFEASFIALCRKAIDGDNPSLLQTIAYVLDVHVPSERKHAEKIVNLEKEKRDYFRKMMGIDWDTVETS